MDLIPISFTEDPTPATDEDMETNIPHAARMGKHGPLLVWKKGVISLHCPAHQIDLCRPIAVALKAGIYGEEGETY